MESDLPLLKENLNSILDARDRGRFPELKHIEVFFQNGEHTNCLWALWKLEVQIS